MTAEQVDADAPEVTIGELLEAAVEKVRVAEEKAKQANIERKAARNKLAELLQGLGLTGFQMGA